MKKLIILPILLAAAALLYPALAQDRASDERGLLDTLAREWADDPVWFDGKAEIAEYEATRTIYGRERRFTAKFMTNKEHADPVTRTKATGSDGRAVFKFHAREDVPTGKYTYHYSTMVYVGVDNFKSLKIDMGSQEDCGSTFKQVVNHAGVLSWHQFSYFPGEGHRSGEAAPPGDLIFHDALPLVLRGLPFDKLEAGGEVHFSLLPDQTTTKWGPAEPVRASLRYAGEEELVLPYGKVKAHRVAFGPEPVSVAWFASDPALRHIMVQYEGADGTSYRLKRLTREAYWVE